MEVVVEKRRRLKDDAIALVVMMDLGCFKIASRRTCFRLGENDSKDFR